MFLSSVKSRIYGYAAKFSLVIIVLWHVNALPGNGSINTPQYTQAAIEQRGYVTRF
jgi:hypothetical protein